MTASRLRAALAALLVSATGSFGAQAASDRVKIGVLTDMSGAYAAITGKGSVAAAQLAVEDFGGSVLGRPVGLVVGDHTQKPDVGAAIAREWYDVAGVDARVC